MSATEETIIELIRQRGIAGREKYGTTMDRADLAPIEWAQHLQEELADGLQYAERVKGALELLEFAREIIHLASKGLYPRYWGAVWLDKYEKQFGK